MAKWLDDVIGALEDLGGKGTLSEIYEAVRNRRKTALPKEWQASVRKQLEHHSSDTQSFQGKRDLFASDGIGTGIWSLRDYPSVDHAWSDAERAELVSDYFSMLADELRGRKYNKTAHRKQLMDVIDRTNGAIERKHQNVSAVLKKLGYPWIKGYKPLRNFQESLAKDVLNELLMDDLDHSDAFDKPQVYTNSMESIFVSIPQASAASPQNGKKFTARKVDFAAIEAGNKIIGRGGEEFVVDVERARLRKLGLTKQARNVRWIAKDEGDGLGYDVVSFDEDGEIFIEVKTTRSDSLTPFFLTETERLASIVKGSRFRLYRVFEFGRSPKIFVVPGPLVNHLMLEPTAYRASILPPVGK